MAKGTRNKGGSTKGSSQTTGGRNNDVDNKTQNGKQSENQKHQRSNKKIKEIREEEDKSNHIDEKVVNDQSAMQQQDTKKDQSSTVKKTTQQPTNEQIMLAQIVVNPADDPNQRQKIQQVMDITDREEDEVATALFDAGWDQNRAVELLLEDEGLGTWKETGKKKKKKQIPDDNKDDWDDGENHDSQRDRGGSRQRAPPRLRRGGSNQAGRGGGGNRGESREDGNEFRGNSFEGGPGGGGRGGSRRGDFPPRRGGRGGGARGGSRTFNSERGPGSQGADRGPSNRSEGHPSNSGTGAFSGSIDTWTPPGGTSGSGAGSERERKFNKDAFENAGNWGDDFPTAEDWDNEEYTGSLADTKVFTNQKRPAAVGQNRNAMVEQANNSSFATKANPSNTKSQTQQQPPQQQQPKPGIAPISSLGGSGSTASYSPIDLSTLLSKPTTQSSINNTSSASLLPFSHQTATDSIKAAVGIGNTSSNSGNNNTGKSGNNDLSYSSYSSGKSANYSSAAASGSPSNYSQNSAFSSIKPSPNGDVIGQRQGSRPQQGGPKQNNPKIPSSAVEMPGDALGRLDVQFGGLDLQFGNSGNGDSSAGTGNTSGFEFKSNNPSAQSSTSDDKYGDKTNADYIGGAPSAKEVNKTLSSAVLSGGKLSNANDVYSSQTDNRKQPGTSSNYSNTRNAPTNNLDALNKPQGDLNSYSNYGNYQGKPSQYGQTQSSGYAGQDNRGNQYANSQFNQSTTASSSNFTNGSYQSSNYTSSKDPNYSGYGNNAQQPPSGSAYKSSSGNSGSGNQYPEKFPSTNDNSSSGQHSSALPGASAVLGSGLTTTTNALKGSATSSSKVNVPNIPPGVTNIMAPPYMIGNPSIAPYLSQAFAPQTMYSYSGLEDLRLNPAAAAGLHTLVGSAPGAVVGSQQQQPNVPQPGAGKASTTVASSAGGYYDPNTPFPSTSHSNTRIENATSSSNNSLNFTDTSKANQFGTPSNAALDSSVQSVSTATQQQPAFNLNHSAFAPQGGTFPPGYAYYIGMPSGYGTTGGVYPAPMAVPTAAATNTTQFQPKNYGSNYGSYDALQGQTSGKDFSNYSAGNATAGKVPNAASGSTGAAPGTAQTGKGHHYWGNSAITNSHLW